MVQPIGDSLLPDRLFQTYDNLTKEHDLPQMLALYRPALLLKGLHPFLLELL